MARKDKNDMTNFHCWFNSFRLDTLGRILNNQEKSLFSIFYHNFITRSIFYHKIGSITKLYLLLLIFIYLLLDVRGAQRTI